MYEVIVNPASRSGKGKEIWKNLEKVFVECGAEYRVNYTRDFSVEDDTVVKLYEEYQAKGEVLHLVVMGGDGTINGILQKLPGFDNLKFSIIPIGSSNDLARDMNLEKNPEDMIRHLINKPVSRLTDVGVLHCENRLVRDGVMDIPDRRFIVSTGIGFDAAVCEEALNSKIKKTLNKIGLGKLTYVGIALKQLASTRYITGELTIDKNEENIIPLEKLLFVAGMNHRFEGGGFMFGPEAVDSDGIFELCVVSRISKGKILRVLPTAYKGEHYKYDGVESYKARQYTVRTSEPLWVHVDGEVGTKADFISVTSMQEVLNLVY